MSGGVTASAFVLSAAVECWAADPFVKLPLWECFWPARGAALSLLPWPLALLAGAARLPVFDAAWLVLAVAVSSLRSVESGGWKAFLGGRASSGPAA